MSWQGRAADSARSYFHNLAGQVQFQVSTLQEIERQLNNIAESMANLARFLSDMLQLLTDLAIAYGIQALIAAGPNPDPTGASRVAALAAMAATAFSMYRTFTAMVGKVTAVYDGFLLLWSFLENQSRSELQNLPELGGKSYDHTGVD